MPDPDMTTLLTLTAGLGALFALAVLILAAYGFYRFRKGADGARALADEAAALLSEREEGVLPAQAVQKVFAEAANTELAEFGAAISRQSSLKFEGRILPDPVPLLASRKLFTREGIRSLSRLLAWVSLALGTACLAVFLALGASLPLPEAALPSGLMVFLVSLLFALFQLWQGGRSIGVIQDQENRFITALEEVLPVFTQGTGTALLVSETIGYGEKMREEVQSFSVLARDLTEGGFADGINKSVREIMSQEVAPPLQEANQALTDLARSLADKQEKGMEELAGTFSTALSESLAVHLAPLPDKLQILHQVAAHSADMMEEASASMARTREDSRAISGEVQEAIRLMTLAKDELAGEMASISGSMEIMSASADKMTALYTGEQTNLASHIKRMADQLEFYSNTLGTGIDESAKAIETSVRMSASQNKHTAVLLERLDEQIGMLEELGRLISENTTNFTKESGGFVSRTLEDFDRGLAEVVERLTFTTAEIRDAVESLPAALRSPGPGRES